MTPSNDNREREYKNISKYKRIILQHNITMKKYAFILYISLFITCDQVQQEPEIIIDPEEPEIPCGCCKVDPIEGYVWYRELTLWNYPSRQDYNTYEEWKSNLQIPEDVLHSLSTKDLVEICIQYPLGIYGWVIVTSDYSVSCRNWNDCMDNLISSHNGLSELYKREDSVKKLLEKYDEIVMNMASFCSNDNQGSSFNYGDLEMLLGYYQSKEDNAVEIYKEILRHLLDGFHAKLSFPEFFTPTFYFSNIIARANMIERISPNSLLSQLTHPYYIVYFPLMFTDTYNLINELSYKLSE